MRISIMALLTTACLTAAAETARPLVAVPRTDGPPQIDGSVADGEWDGAAVTCGFRDNGTGLPARAPVVMSLCYDETALYCLLECRGEASAELKGGPGPRDASIWGGSLAEVFLAPESWPESRYAHFGINHAGTVADEMCDAGDFDGSWDPEWQHAVGTADAGWLAEIAIPWRSLGVEEAGVGAGLRANFARNAASIRELSTWAPVEGGFHHPEQFGTLLPAGEGPAAAVAALPGRRTGGVSVQARLLGEAREARLQVTLTAGEPPAEHVYSAGFLTVEAGGPEATVALDIPDGALELAVSVADDSGEQLWRQTARLELPAFGARIRRLLGTLDALTGGDLPLTATDDGVEADLAELWLRLSALADEAREPLDEDGLRRLEAAIGEAGRRINGFASLAESHRSGMTRGIHGTMPSYFVTNPVSTRKIQPTAADPGPLADELRIAMAKGEYEPAQLVVCPVTRDLERVRVSAGRLTGPNGRVIPGDRVIVNPLGFVPCGISTQGARLVGDVPDVLLPPRAVDVPAGRRQPFFITVQTTPEDAPGEYRGHVWVRARDASQVRLRLVVRVYDVTLPVRSHLRTAFVLWNGGLNRFVESAEPDALMDAYIRYSKVMLAHRISPITMWRLGRGEDGNWEFSDVDRYLSELGPLGLTTFNIGGNGYMAKTRDVEAARAMAEHLKQGGWWDLHYVYGQDEAPKGARDELRANYTALVQAVPDIRIMQTGWSPDPDLEGLVRIWCPLTATADLEAVRAAQQDGDEVWWYVCCSPIAPYANLFVDYPGIDHRILGWMTYRHGIGGFLYWGVNVWSHNPPPLGQYDEADYSNWNPNSYSTINGDGYLLYPGAGDTAVPSLRLALLRDGFEDYDLFTEVAALAGHSRGPLAERARGLLAFEAPLITSLREHTQDGADLLSRREEVLRAGEQLARAGSGEE